MLWTSCHFTGSAIATAIKSQSVSNPALPSFTPGCVLPSKGSLLADQKNKCSGSYQQGKQSTDDERNNPMPTGLDLFRLGAFLRRSDAQPEEKVAHAVSRRHRRGFVAALLCLRIR